MRNDMDKLHFENPDFTEERLKKVSNSCFNIYKWIKHVFNIKDNVIFEKLSPEINQIIEEITIDEISMNN
jgi:hypothetical protein